MIRVDLTLEELQYAKAIGIKRQKMHEAAGHADGKVRKKVSGAVTHIHGAVGEFAVSKGYNLPWDGEFFEDEEWQLWRNKGHDVSGVEARSTTWSDGRLLLHRCDEDSHPFALVRLFLETKGKWYANIVGWAWAKEGKQEKWWEEGKHDEPCFYVPNRVLRSTESLENVIVESGFRKLISPNEILYGKKIMPKV